MGITEISLDTVVQYCTERYGVQHRLIEGTPITEAERGIKLIVPDNVDTVIVSYTDENGYDLTHNGIDAWETVTVVLFPSDLNVRGRIDIATISTHLIFKGECVNVYDLSQLKSIETGEK